MEKPTTIEVGQRWKWTEGVGEDGNPSPFTIAEAGPYPLCQYEDGGNQRAPVRLILSEGTYLGGPQPSPEVLPAWEVGQRRRGDISDIGIKGLLYELTQAPPQGSHYWTARALEAHVDGEGQKYPAGDTWGALESWPSTLLVEASPEVQARECLIFGQWLECHCGGRHAMTRKRPTTPLVPLEGKKPELLTCSLCNSYYRSAAPHQCTERPAAPQGKPHDFRDLRYCTIGSQPACRDCGTKLCDIPDGKVHVGCEPKPGWRLNREANIRDRMDERDSLKGGKWRTPHQRELMRPQAQSHLIGQGAIGVWNMRAPDGK